MSNAVHVIHPYRMGTMWVFDDARFKLDQEPFVGSTNAVIDAVLERAGLGSANQFTLVFSQYPLPNAVCHFARKETVLHPDHKQSAWYFDSNLGVDFWLCPAMNHYFGTPPEQIFIAISPYTKSKTEKNTTGGQCQ